MSENLHPWARQTFNRAAFVSPNLMREKNFIRGKCVVRFIVLLRGVATFLREGRKDFLGSEGWAGMVVRLLGYLP